MTIPETKGISGLWKARKAARHRMSQYVHVLSFFSDFKGDSLSWTDFDFKEEYGELKRAGLVIGYMGNVVDSETLQSTGEQTLDHAVITVEGVAKMAELSEFLWKTSLPGKATATLIQMFWLIAGVVIGHIMST